MDIKPIPIQPSNTEDVEASLAKIRLDIYKAFALPLPLGRYKIVKRDNTTNE